MATTTVSAFSLYTPNSSPITNPVQFHLPCTKFKTHFKNSPAISNAFILIKHKTLRPTKLNVLADEEEEQNLIPDEESPASVSDQTVSVPVSPSDMLNMFFQAEGTMPDSAISGVCKALEEVEGVTDLKVQIHEGLASVELTKQTTVQATGVASTLVEIIQGSGFKLQTLNLSFQDEDDIS